MLNKNRRRLVLDTLEERCTPAAWSIINTATYVQITQLTPTATTLTITDTGATITLVDDAAGPDPTINTSPGATVIYNFISSDGDTITYDQTGARSGNVTLNLNNAVPRTLNMGGGSSILGSLTINSGNGAASINLGDGGAADSLTVGGNLTVNGNLGDDTVRFGDVAGAVVVQGNVTASGVNTFNMGIDDSIGGNLSINNYTEGENNEFLAMAGSFVGGTFTYQGGSGIDTLTLSGVIGRNTTVNFNSQGVLATSGLSLTGSITGGGLTVIGGNLGIENVTLDAASLVGGSLYFNMGGGTAGVGVNVNTVDVLGSLGGSTISYQGGIGRDALTIFPAVGSGLQRISASTGGGDDAVTINNTNSTIAYAYVNLGAGTDTFTAIGPYFPNYVIGQEA